MNQKSVIKMLSCTKHAQPKCCISKKRIWTLRQASKTKKIDERKKKKTRGAYLRLSRAPKCQMAHRQKKSGIANV